MSVALHHKNLVAGRSETADAALAEITSPAPSSKSYRRLTRSPRRKAWI